MNSFSVAVDERVIATRWQIQVANMETFARFIMKRNPHQGKNRCIGLKLVYKWYVHEFVWVSVIYLFDNNEL